MRKGIIQYLTREDVIWDNLLVKGISVLMMFMVVAGIKEGARRRATRRRSKVECEWMDDEEKLQDDSLFKIATPERGDWWRRETSRRQRRIIVREHLKHVCYDER